MTEDITPDYKTFDLLEAIEGRTYPEETVQFLFDERAANAVYAVNKELQKLLLLGKADEYRELEKTYFDMIEGLRGAISTVTVRAVDRKTRKAWIAKAQAKHPDQQADAFGNVKPNHEGLEYLELLKWQSHIVKIEGPDGSVAVGPFSEEMIERLMDKAPDASLAAVAEKIQELTDGPKSGYEQAIRNIDFLSNASPEATAADTQAPSE